MNKKNSSSKKTKEKTTSVEENTEVVDDIEVVDEVQTSENDNKIEELTDRLQRTMAEFDNFRKRTLKEKASMYDDGVKDTIEKLLPILDNFERALLTDKDSTDSFYVGIEMIYKQFLGFFTENAIEEILALNEKFDPNLHFAVSHVEDEKFGENEINSVMQKGYTYKGKVIRHSMVQVAN